MRLASALLLAAGLTLGGASLGAPPSNQPMDTHLLERTDLAYRFSSVLLDSNDGQRHYQVWLGIPRHPAPAGGYPVLYMLDGNAAVEALDATQLDALDRGQAPLLVAVGYAGGQRINRDARTYDYTPVRPQGPQTDAMSGQPSGGADAFLAWLQQHVQPWVAKQAPVDNRRQALWGHSYGGLFVLHVLMTHPDAFSTYVAASPSLWWAPGLVSTESAGLPARLSGARQLWLMKGDAEPALPRPNLPAPTESADTLATQLAKVPGLEVRYQSFPGLNHGPMLPASLHTALEWLNHQKKM